MNRNRLAFALAMAVLAAILLPSPLSAQITFQRTYGDTWDDEGNSGQQTFDGGYIIAGYHWPGNNNGPDFYLIKTDSVGDTAWIRAYGGVGEEIAYDVQQTADAGFIVVGSSYTFSAGYQDVWLVKADANGDTLWARSYGDTYPDIGYSVRQTFDGGYIITGITESYGAGGRDVYLIRTNSSGDTLWTRCFGGAGYDYGYSVQQTSDSGFVVAGYTRSFGAGSYDVYLIRVDAGGDTLWTRTYGGARGDMGYSVQQTADSGFIIVGQTCSFGDTLGDVWLIKTDADGDTLWTRCYGYIRPDIGYSVRQTSDGGYIVTGYTKSFGVGDMNVWLIKTDATGGTTWTRTFGLRGAQVGYSVRQTTDGGYVVAGSKQVNAHRWDVYLIKTDSGGVTVAVTNAPLPPAPEVQLLCEPNPFRGHVTLSLSPSIPLSLFSGLRIFDASGRLVRNLSAPSSPVPRPYSLSWDGTDNSGRRLAPGSYFCRVSLASGRTETLTVVLLR